MIDLNNQIEEICANLAFELQKQKNKVVLVTSSIENEGKTTLAKAITDNFIHNIKFQRILIIDANFEHPSLTEELGLTASKGFGELLTETSKLTELDQLIINTQNENLKVLPIGKKRRKPNMGQLFSQLKTVLEYLKAFFDIIIIDGSSLMQANAKYLAKACDGAILTVKQNTTSKEAVVSSLNRLKMVDANLIGYVLNYAY